MLRIYSSYHKTPFIKVMVLTAIDAQFDSVYVLWHLGNLSNRTSPKENVGSKIIALDRYKLIIGKTTDILDFLHFL